MHKPNILSIILVIAFAYNASAQLQHPVSWNYSAKKINDKTYEVHLTAAIERPWHIYSQFTPAGGPVPSKIVFNKNPLVNGAERTEEKGKLLQKHEDVFGVDVKYFDGSVDFVQTVTLKSKVKTNITGTITYMVCNDQQCLPPATIPFSVSIK